MTPTTITIPAATAQEGVFTMHTTGKYFLLTATNGAFTVITDKGDEYDFSETGSGFGPTTLPFGKLTFYNAGAGTVTLTFYVSNSPIKTPDVNVNSTVNVQQAPIQNTLAGCAGAGENQIVKVTGGGGGAIAIANPGTYFRSAIIIALQSLDRAANTGNVYLGAAAAHQPITLTPGDTYTISAPTGAKRDLGNWYISADNGGDGVVVIYT